nr:maturase R [Acorus tatarinowii]
MKEAIRIVPESIYDREFPDSSSFSRDSVLRRIKEEWGTSRWFLSLSLRTLCPNFVFKEEIDDPKFFYFTQSFFVDGLLYQKSLVHDSVPHSVLLSALPCNIYLHKLDQEIGRTKLRLCSKLDLCPRTPLKKTSSLLCAAFQIWGVRESLGRATFDKSPRMIKSLTGAEQEYIRICYARYANDSLLGIMGDVEFIIEIEKRLTYFLQSRLNLLEYNVNTTIAARSTVEFLGMVIRQVPPRTTPIQFLRELEIRKRVKTQFGHKLWTKQSRNAREGVQFTKDLSRELQRDEEGDQLTTIELRPSRFAHATLDRSPQLCKLRLGFCPFPSPRWVLLIEFAGAHSLYKRSKSKALFSGSYNGLTQPGTEVRRQSEGDVRSGEGLYSYVKNQQATRRPLGGTLYSVGIRIEAPIKKILRRLRDRGLISRRRPWPIHVACLTNVSDGDIVNWSAGIAISLLSYYRCCDNFDQVRTIVDHQIRWSAIFTLAHKHKSSARNIIQKYSKDLLQRLNH